MLHSVPVHFATVTVSSTVTEPYKNNESAAMTNLLLYQRIAQQLADDIRRGVYQPGERVPSVRKMSAQLNVSHATVLQAYANLEDQGLIRARPQSGYYVHQTPALTA
ncbi:winged helix-turn-helix domain-containing protein, partial [Pseudomonas taiwanensis]|uniref:winged helix-turn-helix domain-containing protein n=1 Tax=Pseudomonas taiwanensis TaxID=470150 RepID=UPI0027425192